MAVSLDNYVEVSERIEKFYERFPEGSLRCKEIREVKVGGADYLIYVAQAFRTPDDEAPAEGAAWEPVPGKTNFTRDSELMNAETSAWGRAIAALGFEVKRGIASRDEQSARSATNELQAARDKAAKSLKSHGLSTAAQRDLVHAIAGDPPTVEGLQRVIDTIESEGVDGLYEAAAIPKPEMVAKRQEAEALYAEVMEGDAAKRRKLPKGRFAAELEGCESVERVEELIQKVKGL